MTAVLSLLRSLRSNKDDLKSCHKWNGEDEKPHGYTSLESLPSRGEAQEGEAHLGVIEIAFIEGI